MTDRAEPHDDPSQAAPAAADAPQARPQIKLHPLAIAVGALVAFLALRLLALALGASGVGGAAGQVYLLPLAQFIALYSGGFTAGKLAPSSGFINGVAVAVLFIVVWAVLNAVDEADLVREAGPLALPKMNLGGVVIGDLLNLIPAAFGGWLAERNR